MMSEKGVYSEPYAEFHNPQYDGNVQQNNGSTPTSISGVNSITISAGDINGNKKLATDRLYKVIALLFGIVLLVLLIAVIVLIIYVVSTNYEIKRLRGQVDDLTSNTPGALIQPLAQTATTGSPSSERGGSVYTGWGRNDCGNDSTLLYEGVVGGTNVGSTGGGVDFQCLHLEPEWLNFNKSATGISLLRGVGYITHAYGIFPDEVHVRRAVCARCYTENRPANMMIPGRTSCPKDWHREYYGYLMASFEGYAHPSSYICVDHDPKHKLHSVPGFGAGLTFVSADCANTGTLDECEPGQYEDFKQVACVVCSK